MAGQPLTLVFLWEEVEEGGGGSGQDGLSVSYIPGGRSPQRPNPVVRMRTLTVVWKRPHEFSSRKQG